MLPTKGENYTETKIIIDKQAAVTHISQKRGVFGHFWGVNNVYILSMFRHNYRVFLLLSQYIMVTEWPCLVVVLGVEQENTQTLLWVSGQLITTARPSWEYQVSSCISGAAFSLFFFFLVLKPRMLFSLPISSNTLSVFC